MNKKANTTLVKIENTPTITHKQGSTDRNHTPILLLKKRFSKKQRNLNYLKQKFHMLSIYIQNLNYTFLPKMLIPIWLKDFLQLIIKLYIHYLH